MEREEGDGMEVTEEEHRPGMGPCTLRLLKTKSIRKLGRHWYDQTVMTRANLVDTV